MAPLALTDDVRAALTAGRLAHLTTINPDGSPQVIEGGASEQLQRLAGVYVGPDVKFPPFADPPPGHVIHITPERIGGVGPWAG